MDGRSRTPGREQARGRAREGRGYWDLLYPTLRGINYLTVQQQVEVQEQEEQATGGDYRTTPGWLLPRRPPRLQTHGARRTRARNRLISLNRFTGWHNLNLHKPVHALLSKIRRTMRPRQESTRPWVLPGSRAGWR